MSSQLTVILFLMAAMTCSQAYQQIFFINAFARNNSFYCLQTIMVGKLYNITCLPGAFESATLSSDKGSIIVVSNLKTPYFVVTQLSLLDGSVISNQSLLNQTVLLTDLMPDKSGTFLYGRASAYSYNSDFTSFVVLQPTTGKQTSLTSWSWRDFSICFGEGCNRQAAVLTSLRLYCFPVEGSDLIFLFNIDGTAPMQRFHLPGAADTLLLNPFNQPSQLLGVLHLRNDPFFEFYISLIDVKANTVDLHAVNFTNVMNPCPHGIVLISSSVDLVHQLLFVVIGCPTSLINYSEQKLIVLDVSTMGNFSIVQTFPLQNIDNTQSLVFVTP